MINKTLILGIVVVLIQHSVLHAQARSSKQERKLEARNQINQLRQGTLFVELLDETYLTNVSTQDLGMQLKDRIDEHAQAIQNAFNEYYEFSDVKYFYRSEYPNPRSIAVSDTVIYHTTSEIQQYVSTNQAFTIASFATTPSYEVIQYVNPEAKGTAEQNRNNQYKEYATPRTGLFLSDPNWRVIDKPFPNYVRTTTIFLSQDEINDAVIKLNKILFKYYNKVN